MLCICGGATKVFKQSANVNYGGSTLRLRRCQVCPATIETYEIRADRLPTPRGKRGPYKKKTSCPKCASGSKLLISKYVKTGHKKRYCCQGCGHRFNVISQGVNT